MKDYIYYVESRTKRLYVLGEVQTGFNISLTIDGTKDSSKIVVHTFENIKINPYTIIFHKLSNTWWIVSNDKVEKYVNESGYLYKHTISLIGAIELLNARDLTDCGFYQNTYTISSFVNRLFSLSNFEYSVIINADYLDLNKNVDYIKTFENYTLLSALREFFDAYNCSIKLSFNINLAVNQEYYGTLTSSTLNVIEKTGTSTIVNESIFNGVQEQRTIDKNSFGTCVVSNAENVVSTQAKTFPTIGTVKLTSTQYDINKNNAILRLPSPIYKVNWLQLVRPLRVEIRYTGLPYNYYYFYLFNDTEEYINRVINETISSLENEEYASSIINEFTNNRQEYIKKFQLAMRTTLYTGWRYNPINETIIPPDNNSDWYAPQIKVQEYNGIAYVQDIYVGGLYICTKDERNTLRYPMGTISYSKGDDYIDTFRFLEDLDQSSNHQRSFLINYNSTDIRIDSDNPVIWEESPSSDSRISLESLSGISSKSHLASNAVCFRVNYIPMSDMKVKYDNKGDSKDIQLYNQNGKLTDSVALSKLILSYSKEIESDNIVRYGTYNGFGNVPYIGNRVSIDNEMYVVNNVSIDLYQNEIENDDIPYYIVGEFSLSKSIAVKSLLTNPNTEIRDYGIPQKFNIKRKQLYRDFYEISHSVDSNADNNRFMPITSIVNLGFTQEEDSKEHIAVIKLEYEDAFGGDSDNNIPSSDTWYYQLDTTAYKLKKSYYEIIDFKDNNIIGYGSQNVSCGFDITRILTGTTDNVNTPINYVDDNGRVESFEIAMCDKEQLTYIYDNYVSYLEYMGETVNKELSNYSIFIDSKIYEGNTGINPLENFLGAKDYNDFMISELQYNKDAIEVPIFEYSCQIDDSKDVIVGEDILEDLKTQVNVFKFVLANKNEINNTNWESLTIQNVQNLSRVCNNVVKITSFTNTEIRLQLYQQGNVDLSTNSVVYLNEYLIYLTSSYFKNKDLVIVKSRVSLNSNNNIEEQENLLFVIKNMENAVIDTNTNELVLKINHYKLN